MADPNDSAHESDSLENETQFDEAEFTEPSREKRWLLLIALAFALVVVVGAVYIVHQQRGASRLIQANSILGQQLNQTRSQMASLEARLQALSIPPAPRPLTEFRAKTRRRVHVVPSRAQVRHRRQVNADEIWKRQVSQQLSEEASQLAATRQDLAKAQSDLANGMNQTQDSIGNLSGTIARNHAELVALERLGERNYYEFDLYKSKRFDRAGPISLSLRHTNTKHQNYNIVMLVDDHQLMKKHVNLYEPIRFATQESAQPFELVVNRIGKNYIHGYVSVPKPNIETTAGNPAGAPATPTVSPSPATASSAGSVALSRRSPGPQL